MQRYILFLGTNSVQSSAQFFLLVIVLMDSISLTCIVYSGQKNVGNFLNLWAWRGLKTTFVFTRYTTILLSRSIPVFHLKACLSD